MSKKIGSRKKLSLRNYSKPDAEVINFDYSDIISTSGCEGDICFDCPKVASSVESGYSNISLV